MTSPLDSLVSVGVDVLSTTVDPTTNTILATLGNAKTGEVFETDVRVFQSGSVFSRPSPPTPDGEAAQAIVLRLSSGSVILAIKDSRTQANYGAIAPGEFAFVAGGADGKGQARILGKADGKIVAYTKATPGAASSMVLMMDPASDSISALNSAGNGVIIDPSGVRIVTGGTGAALTLKSGGDASLVGTGKTQIDGASIALGSMPLPGVGAALHGLSGMAGVASLKVSIE